MLMSIMVRRRRPAGLDGFGWRQLIACSTN